MPIMLIMLIILSLSLSLSVVESRALLVRDAPPLFVHTPSPSLCWPWDTSFVRWLARWLESPAFVIKTSFLSFLLTY